MLVLVSRKVTADGHEAALAGLGLIGNVDNLPGAWVHRSRCDVLYRPHDRFLGGGLRKRQFPGISDARNQFMQL